MTCFRFHAPLLVAVALLVAAAGGQNVPARPKPDVRQLLEKFIGYSPDPCGPEPSSEKDWHTSEIETPLFDRASELVVDALNTGTAPPKERAAKALQAVQQISDEVNAVWPKDNRFSYEILDLKAILVVEMAIRTHSQYFVFGIPQTFDAKLNTQWRLRTIYDDETDPETPGIGRSLYALHAGPSGKPRFLVSTIWSGCAGSMGITYEAREWDPSDYGDAAQIIDLKGALPLDDDVKGFPAIGKLRTDGPIIDLPYCWWSSIDTWDNPSMCAVDRYDLSADGVRFVSRRVNRPDLLPIAKAVEYAAKHDIPAVRGYCVNDAVARRLVEWAPRHSLFDFEVKVKRLGPGRERVYDDSNTSRFVVEKRGDRWLVADFRND